MSIKLIQDILPFVEKPSQYLGSEINTIKKQLDSVKLKMVLAFPDLYEIGTSHFGLQILYHILNKHPEIAAERVFAPGIDMENQLRQHEIPLGSLESKTPLRNFDIIGFSLLYELNYTNVLTILDLAQIPFYASKRNDSFPIVIGGGPCMCNPEPVADFFDAIVIGDGEYIIQKMTDTWFEWRLSGSREKEKLLKIWSTLEGVYIPSFFKASFNHDGFQTLIPKLDTYTKIKRTIVPDLDQAPFPGSPVLPFGRPIHDRLRLEIARGCTRGCRFCQAGMIYRPVRERSMESILSIAKEAILSTGYEDLSLLSLSTGDYSYLIPLMQQLMGEYAKEHIAVSLPSLRAESLTPELMTLIKQVRKTGFTIAPEAGSQRLRDIVNKNISDKEVFDTVKNAFDLGWNIIKLYFMIGLPFETQDDLMGIVHMVSDLQKLRKLKGRNKKINVSITTFIPKAHVPFQWARQISLDESREKITFLQHNLKMSSVAFKYQQPEVSFLEGLFARGDRRLSQLLVTAYNHGCRFDGWSDKFNFKLWQDALKDSGIDTDFFLSGQRCFETPLPWDHIKTGVKKSFLYNEWEKANKQDKTPDCRNNACSKCGVCDFKYIQPIIIQQGSENPGNGCGSKIEDKTYVKYRITWSKKGQAKFFGHLELVNIFFRAIKRAGIPVRFTQGFHPKPRISFNDPLPLGMESLEEYFYMFVEAGFQSNKILQGLNKQLPDGLLVTDCRIAPVKDKNKHIKSTLYEVILSEGKFNTSVLNSYNNASEVIYRYRNRKSKLIDINLKDMIANLNLIAYDHMKIELNHQPGKIVRPLDILIFLFGFSEEAARRAGVIKICDKY